MSLATKSSLSSNFEALNFFFILESCSGGPILAFIGVRPGVGPEGFSFVNCLLPTQVVWELSQSSGEPILDFIGCKTGGKPYR